MNIFKIVSVENLTAIKSSSIKLFKNFVIKIGILSFFTMFISFIHSKGSNIILVIQYNFGVLNYVLDMCFIIITCSKMCRGETSVLQQLTASQFQFTQNPYHHARVFRHSKWINIFTAQYDDICLSSVFIIIASIVER